MEGITIKQAFGIASRVGAALLKTDLTEKEVQEFKGRDMGAYATEAAAIAVSRIRGERAAKIKDILIEQINLNMIRVVPDWVTYIAQATEVTDDFSHSASIREGNNLGDISDGMIGRTQNGEFVLVRVTTNRRLSQTEVLVDLDRQGFLLAKGELSIIKRIMESSASMDKLWNMGVQYIQTLGKNARFQDSYKGVCSPGLHLHSVHNRSLDLYAIGSGLVVGDWVLARRK